MGVLCYQWFCNTLRAWKINPNRKDSPKKCEDHVLENNVSGILSEHRQAAQKTMILRKRFRNRFWRRWFFTFMSAGAWKHPKIRNTRITCWKTMCLVNTSKHNPAVQEEIMCYRKAELDFDYDDVCNVMSTGTWKHFKIRNASSTERRRQNAERRAQSAEDRAQKAEHMAQSAEHRVQRTEYMVQSTKHRWHSAERRAQSAEKIMLDIKNKKGE